MVVPREFHGTIRERERGINGPAVLASFALLELLLFV